MRARRLRHVGRAVPPLEQRCERHAQRDEGERKPERAELGQHLQVERVRVERAAGGRDRAVGGPETAGRQAGCGHIAELTRPRPNFDQAET